MMIVDKLCRSLRLRMQVLHWVIAAYFDRRTRTTVIIPSLFSSLLHMTCAVQPGPNISITLMMGGCMGPMSFFSVLSMRNNLGQ